MPTNKHVPTTWQPPAEARLPAGVDRIRTLDARAVAHSVDVARGITQADLGRPTPCEGWTLGDLLAHMTTQHLGFAAAAAGGARDLADWAVRPLGADPAAAYESAAAAVVRAFAAVRPGAGGLALPEIAPGVPFPPEQAIGFHFLDYVVHTWDLTESLGAAYPVEPDLVDAALPLALAVPATPETRGEGRAFAPTLPTTSAATPLARLLAAVGRAGGV
ncbi:TIGR03086 family metal-binding protein [Streptomyces sp. NPDC050560]|uniref:TIGR03086 family metal-binding protein n=1 Tax=Streptomyces sp. NPDC050560 TaxID=3365630 RepID=UPI0037A4E9F5